MKFYYINSLKSPLSKKGSLKKNYIFVLSTLVVRYTNNTNDMSSHFSSIRILLIIGLIVLSSINSYCQNKQIVQDPFVCSLKNKVDSLSWTSINQKWFENREWIELDRVKFIQHSLIASIKTDSIENFQGIKIYINNIHVGNSELYSKFLNPKYQFQNICVGENSDSQYFYKYIGGIFGCRSVYQVIINNDTIIVDSHQKLKEIFAPIDNIEEAIAFASIATNTAPIYNFDFMLKYLEERKKNINNSCISDNDYGNPGHNSFDCIYSDHWVSHLSEIESSYAKKIKSGYELLLYRYDVFGCSHPYIQVKLKVYKTGDIKILNAKRAFDNLEELYFCAD